MFNLNSISTYLNYTCDGPPVGPGPSLKVRGFNTNPLADLGSGLQICYTEVSKSNIPELTDWY